MNSLYKEKYINNRYVLLKTAFRISPQLINLFLCSYNELILLQINNLFGKNIASNDNNIAFMLVSVSQKRNPIHTLDKRKMREIHGEFKKQERERNLVMKGED